MLINFLTTFISSVGLTLNLPILGSTLGAMELS